MENIIVNNGFQNALAGMLIVFAGLILIALVIVVFNFILQPKEKKEKVRTLVAPEEDAVKKEKTEIKDIPEDHLVAISTAIELYRRVHFDILQSEITFVRGEDAQNAWKIGTKFGQR